MCKERQKGIDVDVDIDLLGAEGACLLYDFEATRSQNQSWSRNPEVDGDNKKLDVAYGEQISFEDWVSKVVS
jgi:hypothetical protein